MLHIVTPVFRFELLDLVYRSLPPHDDIVWHLVKSVRRPPLTHDWIAHDPRVRLYEIDCDDDDLVSKRNAVFARITDGFFYLLDDDTVCLDAMYDVYREFSTAGFEGMVVGGSDLMGLRLPSTDPRFNRLDAGVVICHHSVLRVVGWAWSDRYTRDRLFWSRCYEYFGPARTVVVERTIGAYNRFGPLVRVRKRVLGRTIAWDLHHPVLARAYLLAADLRHYTAYAVGVLARRASRGRSGSVEPLPDVVGVRHEEPQQAADGLDRLGRH